MVSKEKKIILVAGARPNSMKIAPIMRIIRQSYAARLQAILVHTGQHYDYEMSQAFFEDLEIRQPEYSLGVGPGSQSVQTAKIMIAFEEVCLKEHPGLVVAVGDVNSTVACTLVAKKLEIGVAHVEAGLRSRDFSMPEEINRLVTDVLSDFLFVSESSGVANLREEGKPENAIFLVGNVMVDTLYWHLTRLPKAEDQKPAGPFAVMTLHRASNVDPDAKLQELMEAIRVIADNLPVHFPIHPRTRQRLEATGLLTRLRPSRIEFLPPLPYQAFLRLWKGAALVLTDSGGLQEETTALGIPCLTIRDNTERPGDHHRRHQSAGGYDLCRNHGCLCGIQNHGGKKGRVPELWDGKAAERIVNVLAANL
jgi:UDP-N-acetylglucosamine 2-epimerase (non-hydrolysing)